VGSCDSRDIGYSSTVTGGSGGETYEWKFYKVGATDPVGTSSTASGTFTPTEDGDYYATLKVTDSRSCTGEDTSNTVTALAPMDPSVAKTSADGDALTVTMTGTWHQATVEWQVRESSSGTWTTISGETAATLIFSAFETYDSTPDAVSFSHGGVNYVGKLYKVDIRIKTSRTINGGCEDYSDPVTISKIIAVDP
jgi:hypothetical protein